jgi:hypothetical protein
MLIAGLVPLALAPGFIQYDGPGDARVERCDLPRHRDLHQVIASLFYEPPQSLPFATHNQRQWRIETGLMIGLSFRLIFQPHQPETLALEFFHRLHEVGNQRHPQVLHRSSGRVYYGGCHPDSAMARKHYTLYAHCFSRAEQTAQVLGILQAVENQQDWAGGIRSPGP